MVFADFAGDFVKVVFPDIGNMSMQTLNFALLFLPVGTEFDFTA
ncbi:hypothetical protein BB2000_0334 [Proteus mirabilis BB2000]|nr:hypothetical protein BB2000_0334 [Proteus mirabilis BB2000]